MAHLPVPLQTGAGGADSAGTLSSLLCANESQLWVHRCQLPGPVGGGAYS